MGGGWSIERDVRPAVIRARGTLSNDGTLYSSGFSQLPRVGWCGASRYGSMTGRSSARTFILISETRSETGSPSLTIGGTSWES